VLLGFFFFYFSFNFSLPTCLKKWFSTRELSKNINLLKTLSN